MNILDKLAEKHNDWIRMAFNICKCSDYSKDVVQDMYIKMYEQDQKIENFNPRDVYVWVTILNIIKEDNRTKQNQVTINECLNLATKDNIYEFDDDELMYLNRAKEFRYLDRGLLCENYDKGLRQVEKDTGVPYWFIHRRLEKTRKLILRDKYDELYKNKRLKYKKK